MSDDDDEARNHEMSVQKETDGYSIVTAISRPLLFLSHFGLYSNASYPNINARTAKTTMGAISIGPYPKFMISGCPSTKFFKYTNPTTITGNLTKAILYRAPMGLQSIDYNQGPTQSEPPIDQFPEE